MSNKETENSYDCSNYQATDITIYMSDLISMRDSISRILGAVKAALTAIVDIKATICNMKDLLDAAKSTVDISDRSKMAYQFNRLRTQIFLLTDEASYRGANLISQSANTITIVLDKYSMHTLTIVGTALNHIGLLATAINNWETDDDIDVAIATTDKATIILQSNALVFNSNAIELSVRLGFLQELISILECGILKLAGSDVSGLAVDLLVLQARQQVSGVLYTLTPLAESSVLSLF